MAVPDYDEADLVTPTSVREMRDHMLRYQASHELADPRDVVLYTDKRSGKLYRTIYRPHEMTGGAFTAADFCVDRYRLVPFTVPAGAVWKPIIRGETEAVVAGCGTPRPEVRLRDVWPLLRALRAAWKLHKDPEAIAAIQRMQAATTCDPAATAEFEAEMEAALRRQKIRWP